jgi:hypothetical protein
MYFLGGCIHQVCQKYSKERQMAIQLHSFVSSEKRYIQVESQLHHIIGIFKKINRSQAIRGCTVSDIYSAYYECEEDGTITFYQAEIPHIGKPGVWTYIAYECPQGEEKVFKDTFIDISLNSIKQLLAGEQVFHVALDIREYLSYQTSDEIEYLDVQLPQLWENREGRKIANLILNEYRALKKSSVFADETGRDYTNAVLDAFIQEAEDILAVAGTAEEFEAAQHEILKNIKIDGIANFILQLNDYRIWQATLPSKSKAVEYAFNTALNFICRMK